MSSFIEISPSILEILNVESNIRYIGTISILNKTKSSLKYRVSRPISSYFQILFSDSLINNDKKKAENMSLKDIKSLNNPTRTLSPGISDFFEIHFEIDSNQKQDINNDKILLEYQDQLNLTVHNVNTNHKQEYTISLIAKCSSPNLEFDGFVQFGSVVLNSRTSAYIELTNTGTKEGIFEIEKIQEDVPIWITPNQGILFPISDENNKNSTKENKKNSKQNLKIEFLAKDIGVFRYLIPIKIGQKIERMIDINATVVEHTIELILPNEGGKLTSVPFGTVYFGEERSIHGLLINNGPQIINYFTNIVYTTSSHENDIDEQTELKEKKNDLQNRKDLIIDPSDGKLPPYSETPIHFLYKPLKRVQRSYGLETGSASELQQTSSYLEKKKKAVNEEYLQAKATLSCKELTQICEIDVSGKAIYPCLELSHKTFDFGNCSTGERADFLLNVKNNGSLRLNYLVNKVAQFSCLPNKGRLESMQSQSIVVSFKPSQLGTFQNTIHFVIGKNLLTIPLKLRGVSNEIGKKKLLVGGTEALPEDFQPILNFVRVEDITASSSTINQNFVRVPPWELAAKNGTAVNTKEAFLKTNNVKLTYSIHELRERCLHRQEYNDILRDSRIQREKDLYEKEKRYKIAKGLKALNEFDTTNLGISPQSGMDPPELVLSQKTMKKNEPLWLKSNSKSRNPSDSRKLKSNVPSARYVNEESSTHNTDENLNEGATEEDIETSTAIQKTGNPVSLPEPINFLKVVPSPAIIQGPQEIFQIPELTLLPKEGVISFGKVYVGSSNAIKLTLTNQSTYGANLIMEIDKKFSPTFWFSLNKMSYLNTNIITGETDIEVNEEQFLENAYSFFPISKDIINDKNDISFDCPYFIERNYYKWQINLPEKSNRIFLIHFAPSTMDNYSFELNISLLNNNKNSKKNILLSKTIRGQSIKPMLSLSKNVIEYGDCVISRDALRKIPYIKDIKLTNEDENVTTHWSINCSKLKQNIHLRDIFHVGPVTGELAPMDTSTIRISFLPLHSRTYYVELPIFIEENNADDYDGDNQDKNGVKTPYMYIILNGTGIHPRLLFSETQIVLPVVPLGIKAISEFKIVNNGYDNLELNHRIPVDLTKVPIDLIFSQGKNIGLANPFISVQVEFSSKKPLSFSSKIEFFDNEGNQFSVSIIGTTDNSLLSCYEFLLSHREEFSIFSYKDMISPLFLDNYQIKTLKKKLESYLESTNSPINQNKKLNSDTSEKSKSTTSLKSLANTKHNTINKNSSHEKGLESNEIPSNNSQSSLLRMLNLEPTGKSISNVKSLPYSEQEISLLIRWLNANLCKTPISRIPEDIVINDGRQIYEMIEVVCSKVVPGKIARFSNISKEKIEQLVNQYTELLRFLKSYGAFLHTVLPEDLLNCDDYIKLKQKNNYNTNKLGGNMSHIFLSTKRSVYENEWLSVSQKSWIQIIYQIIKTFVLFRITPKTYATLPGSQTNEFTQKGDTLNTEISNNKLNNRLSIDFLNGSNIYSVSENILLNWTLFHYKKACTKSENGDQTMKIDDFMTDFQDGSLIYYLLISHVPSLAKDGGILSNFQLKKITDNHSNNVDDMTQLNDTKIKNSALLKKALIELGLDYDIPDNVLLNMNARENLLFILHLYQFLPQYTPKTIIEFSGVLGKTIQKSIELRNPSKQKIIYYVKLEKSSTMPFVSDQDVASFHIFSNEVILEPEGKTSFIIEYRPRFTKTIETTLTFRSQREGTICGATMVFILKSNIHSRKPIRTINIDNYTYELKNVDITIESPFQSNIHANYQLTLLQDNSNLSKIDSGMNNTNNKHTNKSYHTIYNRISDITNNQHPFYCKNDCLSIKSPGTTGTLTLQFLPLIPGNYKCQLLLLDEKIGEFMYEIIGVSQIPRSIETIKWNTEYKPHLIKEVFIPLKNTLLYKSLNNYIERLHSNNMKLKAREILKKLEDETNVNLKIEFNSPFWSCQSNEVVISDNNNNIKNNNTNVATNSNKNNNRNSSVSIIFQPKGPGIYPCKMMLRASLYDLRVYDIEATVLAPGTKTTLEFSAPARQLIIQDIPLVNHTTNSWNLNASVVPIVDSNNNNTIDNTPQINKKILFTGPSTININGNSSAIYPLQFKPLWIGTESYMLTLLNSITEEKFEYILNGKGEEPLAEDHIVITCQARQTIEYSLPINNYPSVISTATIKSSINTYDAESDLFYVSGPSKIDIDPLKKNLYTFKFNPLIGGTYFGSITFTNIETKEYLWYTIEAKVSSPEPESKLDIKTTVRSAVAVEISLDNPLDEIVTFNAQLDGDGLLGDPTFTLQPKTVSAIYELIFSPLLPGIQNGSIIFSNEKIGEFWYILNLTAEKAEPVELQEMSCAVGGISSQPITIQNPIDENIVLIYKISNKRNFNIRNGSQIELKPFENGTILLDYTPSSLTEIEETEIILHHDKLGDWIYKVKGVGKPPSLMKATLINSVVGLTSSSLFTFRNPFPDPLTVDISLDVPSDLHDIFKILIKKKKNLLPGFAHLQIPISFSPLNVCEKTAQIIVQNEKDLKWIYPLKGIAEAPPFPNNLILSCQAREFCEKELNIVLTELSSISPDNEEIFDFELEIPNEYQKVVQHSLSVTSLVTKIKDKDTPIKYLLRFEPFRALTVTIYLIITKHSGGRWKYEIQLQAFEPAVDDIISIESSIHQTSSVTFRLTNPFPEQTAFHAEFNLNSSSAFTVFPTDGQMEPNGNNDGTQFIVSFTPTEYGKILTGRLNITTDEMQWIYELKGTHPKYKVPIPKSKMNKS